MSVDFEWDALDPLLADTIVGLLNRQLQSVTRPSFLGPIEILSLDFGKVPPDIEILDVRDIYRDFVESDDEDVVVAKREVPATATKPSSIEDEEDYEWVSRRAAGRGMALDGPAYHHLPPHLRYGRGPAADLFAGLAGLSRPPSGVWHGHGSSASLPNLRDLGPLFSTSPNSISPYAAYSSIPLGARTPLSFPFLTHSAPSPVHSVDPPTPERPVDEPPVPTDAGDEPESDQPDVQMHFHVEHQSDARLTLTTSMIINYPSPSFMTLPIKLSVTGFAFNGEVVVAYEGSKKRLHVCILDELDPYGPIGDRPSRSPLGDTTPPDPDGPLPIPSKPPPIGTRLFPSIYIESEIGQTDKHVLKNVSRVERFIQDLIRKTIEDELVFPNFHTILL